MKAIVILIGLVGVVLVALMGGAAGIVRTTPPAFEPVWMMLSGASLIALGSAVRGLRS